jgi:hypothetical protein
MSTDDYGIHRGILMQYELPLNFVLHANLTNNFSAVQICMAENIGLKFEMTSDRVAFDTTLN